MILGRTKQVACIIAFVLGVMMLFTGGMETPEP